MHVEIFVRLCTKHFSHVVSLMQNVFVVYSFPIVSYVLSNCRWYRQRSWWRLKESEMNWPEKWMCRQVDFSWNFWIEKLSVTKSVSASRSNKFKQVLCDLLCWFNILIALHAYCFAFVSLSLLHEFIVYFVLPEIAQSLFTGEPGDEIHAITYVHVCTT